MCAWCGWGCSKSERRVQVKACSASQCSLPEDSRIKQAFSNFTDDRLSVQVEQLGGACSSTLISVDNTGTTCWHGSLHWQQGE